MANNSPTIVAASLSDDQLKKSIDSLVTHVDEAMKKMVQSTNNAVGEMEAKLKSLGNLKIDTGGTNDGGTGRRTQQHEKLTKAVNDASEAVTKETQKLQDLQQSLSGASDREQNFISQKKNAANTIAQENELLQRQEQELANLKNQQSSFSGTNQQTTASIEKQREAVANLKNEVKYWQSIVSQIQSGDKKTRFNNLWIGDTTSKQGHDILDVANKLYSIMQKLGMETEKGSASTGQAVKVVEQLAKYYKISREEAEKLVMSVQESPLARGKFTTHYDTRFGLDNLTMQKKDAEDSALRLLIAQSKLERQTDDLALANKRLADSENSSTQFSQQKAKIDAQVAAKEKEIAETKGRIATATREQTEADKNASQAAREKANIQSQVESQEKKVADAKRQLTTATQQQSEVEKQSVQNIAQQTAARDKQIKKNQETAMSFDNFAKAQQVAIRSANPSAMRNAEELQTMNIQLDLLRERLREARQQYSSFVALAAHATTTGDKGLFQYATDGVHRYEQEVRNLIPQIRGLQNSIQQMGDVIAPQGHTIQNYVNSLQKANPELAALNAQYKSGTSLLQNQNESYSSATGAVSRYTEAIRKQAQAIRESAEYKAGKNVLVTTPSGYDATINIKDRKSIEDKLTETYQKHIGQKSELDRLEQTDNEIAKERLGTETAITNEISKRKKYASPETQIGYDVTRDKLAQIIATRNNIEKNQVVNWDEQTSSIKTLSAALKQYQEAYVKMSATERDSHFGKQMIADMQVLERNIQKLRQQMARPIDFESVMNLPQKTLDDIAYKMRQLASYRSGLNVETQVKEIDQVNKKYAQLQKTMNDIMQKNTDMIASNTALGRSWNYMKNRLAFYFTVGSSTQFIKNLIEVRSQYEMNERALGILIDSAERGTRIFNELSQMALVSPYTLIELSAAAKQLTAYDVAAKDVVDTTRRLADMTAAVGIPIERLTYALGQIKAYGYLNSRDARMFANAGIPLVKQLSEYYTELEGKLVSTADVYDRIKKKAIDYNQVMEVITRMTDEGGKFFDFQAKMADTLKVRLANLTLAWNNMLNDIGKSEQGVLTSGIGLLKELFLRWKDINRVLEDVVIALGMAKAAQLVYYGVVMGTNKAIAIEAVLGTRLSNVLRNLGSTINTVLTSAVTWWSLLTVASGAAIASVLRGNEAMIELNKTMRDNAKSTYDDLEKFSKQYKELRDSLYKTEKDNKGNTVTSSNDINLDEAKKYWEAVREQIELSSHASNEYIGKLLQINNVSERLRQGLDIIDDVQAVSAAVKELGNDGIKLERDWSEWWNLWLFSDGTIGNLKDAHMWLGKIEERYGSIEKARSAASGESKSPLNIDKSYQSDAEDFLENYEKELDKFKKDLETTKESILNFIGTNNWQGDINKINETFGQLTENIIQKSQLSPQQAFTLQLEMEEARTQATQQAYKIRIKDESAALAMARSENEKAEIESRISTLKEEQKFFLSNTATQRVYWNDFTKYLKEQHLSEMTSMFRGMDAKQIASLKFQGDEYEKWVKRMVQAYADSHKMKYDEVFKYLKNWITSANQWSIFIPLTISSDDTKTVIKTLEDADAKADTAWKKIQRLDKEISRLRKKGAKEAVGTEGLQFDESRLSEDDKKLTNAIKERAAAQKDYNDAVAEGGESKKENAAANKAAKQAESELQKALKDELSTIDKVRSIYKDLTKEGMSHANAVERATKGWDETVNAINRVLQKNGLRKLDLSKFAGIENPRELVNMLQSQLNTLLKRGAKPAEIKELQTKIQTLNVDAEKYDLSKITKGLNNKLGKLKDEYELAVELDANPEMGNMFTQMFGLDTTDFPRTIGEYMQRVQNEFDKARMNLNLGTSLNVFKANTEQWYDWGKAVGYSKEQVDDFKKSFDGSISVAKKWAQDVVKQTQDLQYKLADNNGKIAIEEEKLAVLRKRLAKETNEQQKALLELQIQDQQNAIAKLKEEILQMLPTYQRLFGEIAEHSAWMTRKLARDYKNMLVEGKNRGLNADNTYSVRDPISGQITRISKERMGKEIKNADKELQKTQSTIKKITEAFTNGEDKVVDWVHGVELVGEELGKLSNLVDVVGQIADAFGNPNEYNATAEAIHDISSSISGVSTFAQGIGQIASGDYIGGATSALSGLFTTVSAWMDNSDKKIQQSIKDSERAVKRLELAYIDLERAVDNAYGTAVIGAKRAALTNKELQLAELKRQLQLEQSRKSKDRDEEKIMDLQKQIKELENEIKDTIREVVNDLLGVSSVGDAAESVVTSMIEAFKKGEDYMGKFSETFDEMIDNMIMKAIVGEVIGKRMEELFEKIEKIAVERANNAVVDELDLTDSPTMVRVVDGVRQGTKKTIGEWREFAENMLSSGGLTEEGRKKYEEMLKRINELYTQSVQVTPEDVTDARSTVDGWKEGVKEEFKAYMDAFGIKYGQDSTKTLSALQQGIQGVTEDTAGALEAITNGISQQCYLQSDILIQIRDTVQSFDIDIQTASLSQILLQLQSSYQLQQSMLLTMENWTNPSGNAVRVELIS